MFATMKGYMVLLLLCLASLQLIDAGRTRYASSSSRSGGRYSSSSSSRYSSSSYRSAYSSRSGGGYTTRTRVAPISYTRSSSGGGGYYSGRSSSGGGYYSSRSGGGSSVSRSGGGYSGSYVGYSSSSGNGSGTYKNKNLTSKGYGTRWGTNFQNQTKHTRYSKKALGMGVAAGFVGGAVVGGAATAATYGVYHRYNKYRDLMYRRRYGTYGSGIHDDWGWGQYGWSPGYYNDYYRNNRCRYSCPYDDYFTVCRYGFCECDIGYDRRYGRCRRRGYDWSLYTPRRGFNPLNQTCVNNEQCFDYDVNLICDKTLSTASGTCKCRTDMKWNAESYECQLYLDVDCTKFTYETKVSPRVEQAVEKAEQRLANVPQNDESNNILVVGNEIDEEVLNETISIDNVLKTSLLTDIDLTDKSVTDDDITEAYCRDVDALSQEFQKGGSSDYIRSGGGYSSSSSSRYSRSNSSSGYSSRSGGGYSRSSGGSSVSRSGGGYSSRSSSGGGYSGGVSSRSSSGGGAVYSRRSSGGSSVSRGSGGYSGSSGVSRSRNTGYSQSSNHGYGSVYSGYGSGTYKNGGKSFKDKGYGTRWGTIFKKKGKHTGYSKKAFGLGVAAGFVGETVVGGDATAATYGVYHRYNKYRDLMYRHRYHSEMYRRRYHDDWGWGQYGWSPGYYNDYYRNNRCRYSCPYDNDYYSVCRYGFCDCDIGYEGRYGRCKPIGYDWSQYTPRRNFDPLSQSCVNNEQCFDYDFNLICDKSLVTAGSAGRCKCRTDMKWNEEAFECQLYLDVDCTKFTYETKVSPQVEQAVEKAEQRLANVPQNDESINLLVAGNETDAEVLNETISIDNVLKTSLLTDIDPNDRSVTDDDITEAYCRDVDAFSHEFQKGGAYGYNPRRRGRDNLAKKIALGADILSFLIPLLVA